MTPSQDIREVRAYYPSFFADTKPPLLWARVHVRLTPTQAVFCGLVGYEMADGLPHDRLPGEPQWGDNAARFDRRTGIKIDSRGVRTWRLVVPKGGL